MSGRVPADPNHYSRFEARAREIGQQAGVDFDAPPTSGAGTTDTAGTTCAGTDTATVTWTDPSLTMSNPSGKTMMDGHAVSRMVATQVMLAERESGINFLVIQGGFGGSGYAASGTSDNYKPSRKTTGYRHSRTSWRRGRCVRSW